MRSISSTVAKATAPRHGALAGCAPARTSRALRRQHLGVRQAADPARRVEDHRGGVDRSGERPPAGLVHAADATTRCSHARSRPARRARRRPPCVGAYPAAEVVELVEALHLPAPRGAVAQQREQRRRQAPPGVACVLQQFRHQPLAGEDVGQADVRQVEHPPHHRPGDRRLAVGDHHRRLEERRLQGRRAARDQREVGRGKRLVRMAEQQRQRQVGRALAGAAPLEHVARRAGDGGHDEVHVGHVLRGSGARSSTNRSAPCSAARAPAARQQRDDRLARRQAQLRARLAFCRAPAGSRRPGDGRRRSPACRPSGTVGASNGNITSMWSPSARSPRCASRARPRSTG